MKITFIDITGLKNESVNWKYENKSGKPYICADKYVNQRIQVRYSCGYKLRQKYEEIISDTELQRHAPGHFGVSMSDVLFDDEIPLSIGVNAKNLNPFICVGDTSVGCNHVNMIVLTVGNGVSYIRSLAHDEVQVVNTFREIQDPMYKGCCIVYDDNLADALNENTPISLMKLDTLHGDTLVHYEITLDALGCIHVTSSEIIHKNLKSKLMNIYENTSKRRGFISKIWNSGVLSHELHLVHGKIPLIKQTEIDQDALDDASDYNRKILIDDLRTNNNRVVIIQQLRLPKDIIAELKLLYIFAVDETGTIRTIKSN